MFVRGETVFIVLSQMVPYGSTITMCRDSTRNVSPYQTAYPREGTWPTQRLIYTRSGGATYSLLQTAQSLHTYFLFENLSHIHTRIINPKSFEV